MLCVYASLECNVNLFTHSAWWWFTNYHIQKFIYTQCKDDTDEDVGDGNIAAGEYIRSRDEFKFRDLSRLLMVMPQGEIMNIEKFVVVILGAALVCYP